MKYVAIVMMALGFSSWSLLHSQEKPKPAVAEVKELLSALETLRSQSAPKAPLGHKFVELQNLKPQSQERRDAIQLVQRLAPVDIIDSPQLGGAVGVRGTPKQILEAEQLLKKFDVAPQEASAPRQIQTTLFLLEASNSASSGFALPAHVQKVVDQLKATFQFQSYALADSLILQSQEGSKLLQRGTIPVRTPGTESFYGIAYSSVNYNASTKSFAFRGFSLFTDSNTKNEARIDADISLRDGQYLVLGKLNQTDRTIFVVITAKVE